MFPEFDVDCEYNRHDAVPKTINLPALSRMPADSTEQSYETVTAFPDVIVHRRRIDDDNLLVIEGKKETAARAGIDLDIQKIHAYRAGLGYQFGAFVVFPVGAGSDAECIHIEWYGSTACWLR